MEENKITWDYSVWKRFTHTTSNYVQVDWNQTLITMINMVSSDMYGETNKVTTSLKVNQTVSPIFETLSYYKDGYIAGRYEVLFDDDVSDHTINVCNEELCKTIYIDNYQKEQYSHT